MESGIRRLSWGLRNIVVVEAEGMVAFQIIILAILILLPFLSMLVCPLVMVFLLVQPTTPFHLLGALVLYQALMVSPLL